MSVNPSKIKVFLVIEGLYPFPEKGIPIGIGQFTIEGFKKLFGIYSFISSLEVGNKYMAIDIKEMTVVTEKGKELLF